MTIDLDQARALFSSGEYTGVLCRGRHQHVWRTKGLAELVKLIDARIDLRGYSAADKVVGKAAAMLYQLVGVTAVHAAVTSPPAQAQFRAAGIELTYDTVVPMIRNADGSGPCPMEMAVDSTDDPAEALTAIRAQLQPARKSLF
jgi:hypothetical protein